MFHWKDTDSPQLLERRAATAGEQPQSVGDSFYAYFPSFNAVKQRKLEETRKEYFQYLKTVRSELILLTISVQLIILLALIKLGRPAKFTETR